MNLGEILERLDDLLALSQWDTYDGLVEELTRLRAEIDRERRLNPEVYTCSTKEA